MRKGLRLAVVSIAVLGLSLAAGGMALAQSSSGQVATSSQRLNHSLRGTFSLQSFSTFLGLVPAVGTLTFDGKGNVTGTMDINVSIGALGGGGNPVICQGTGLSGTYTVNPDRLTGGADLTVTTSVGACSTLNNTTMTLSLSLVRDGSGVVRTVNMAEMDTACTSGSGTVCSLLDGLPFAAVATRTAR